MTNDKKPLAIFYSDPHLGLELKSNTTPESRERLKVALQEQVEFVLRTGADKSVPVFCGGDFFHSFSNDETVLMNAIRLAKSHASILGGNHDASNQVGKPGSLTVVKEVSHNTVLPNITGPNIGVSLAGDGAVVFSVPHCATRDVYLQCLEKAKEERTLYCKEPRISILLTHCNYDSQLTVKESEMLLTRKQAHELLDSGFDYILTGHEHKPRTDFGGKVIVMGNTHPTGFGDCDGEKYFYVLYSDGSFEKEVLAPNLHVEIDLDLFLESSTGDFAGKFVTVTGDAEPSELAALAEQVNRIWNDKVHMPYAIRSLVSVNVSEVKTEGSEAPLRIEDIIEQELKDQPEMLKLWRKLV